MTLTTIFVNKTTVDFKLKEGNAGVYREVTTLKGLVDADAVPSRHALEFDEKATYREYRTVTRQGGQMQRIQITSDFCLDHSTIYIVPKPGTIDKFEYTGDLRSKYPDPKPGPFNLFGSISKLFSKKS